MSRRTCPDCRGAGRVAALVYSLHCAPQVVNVACFACDGTGEIGDAIPVWRELGEAHRARRIDRGESLGTCATRLGLDARELVDMEHGRADPRRLADDA